MVFSNVLPVFPHETFTIPHPGVVESHKQGQDEGPDKPLAGCFSGNKHKDVDIHIDIFVYYT